MDSRHQRWSGQAEAVGERADRLGVEGYGRHVRQLDSRRDEVGSCRDGFDGNPGFHERATGTAPDPGWRTRCEPLRTDRRSPLGRVGAKTANTVGHKRYPACTSIAHCCGRTGPDGDEQMDGRRLRAGMVHTIQLCGLISKKLEARRVQVLDSDWFKTDHKAVLAVLWLKARMRYSAKLGVNLCGWKPDDSWQRAATETCWISRVAPSIR